jgi:hypothetical protein
MNFDERFRETLQPDSGIRACDAAATGGQVVGSSTIGFAGVLVWEMVER